MEDLFEDPKVVTEEMRMGLARMYTDVGYRLYLENLMMFYNKNAMMMLDGGEEKKAVIYANRYKTVRSLLEKGRQYYERIQDLQKRKTVLEDNIQ